MEQNEGGYPLDSDSNVIGSSIERDPTPQCQPQPAAAAVADVEVPEIELESNQDEEKAATDVAEAVVAQAAPEEEAEPSPDTPKIVSGGKRKRGRPPKSQAAKRPVKKKENEEEEVCFICFDGGNLVCCDRRGCPKVYHAVCVNRDEAFFETKGKWNCGWHICSICEKSAQYMCYTCTYSLCNGCIKGTGFVCVRGKKGFCETCYGTVMLIESKGCDNEGKVGINFDDKSSFECLFKDYWFDVKRRLSLAVEELENAEVPSKGSGAYARTGNSSSDELYDGNNEQEASSDSSSGRRRSGTSSRKKVRRRSRTTVAEESSVVQPVDNLGASFPEYTEWASKELLEFVAHMKGGDKSVLSQFDVQALLLEYIKQNNLRDPRRKSQIICDPRLESLFGKSRVGHFEMLKLLESHFLTKEASQVVTDDDHGAGVDHDTSQMDTEAYADGAAKVFSDKRRKNRKKGEEREQQTNLDDYAAIDVHNIGLIYLRRNLMEDLLDDEDKFTDKIVGAFVRIRIPSAGQKQDMYRLVQVVGTSKAVKRYKTGKKTTDIILEILNLNKREIVTIDKVSNQDFTEEECKRLRQSIKCGLISRLTVGDIHEKARILQAVRVNDWLESEKQRLCHLRDRASETGRRKELRECVEKLQLLSTPEERARKLNEVPEIHSDPKMDPDNVSGDEDEPDGRKQDAFSRPRDSSFRRGGPAPSNWAGGRKGPSSAWDTSRNARIDGARDKQEVLNAMTDGTNEPSWNHGRDVLQPNNWETVTGPSFASWNNNLPVTGPRQSHGDETVHLVLDDANETEKIWHYKDPGGKIQGPFSMVQLRKWDTTGYFPAKLRIWRAPESEEDSILLTDALVGKFEKDLPQWEPPQSNHSQPTTLTTGPESRPNEQSGSWKQPDSLTPVGNDPDTGIWAGAGNIVHQNAERWASQPSAVAAPKVEMTNPREASNVISPVSWETSRDPNSWTGPPQAHINQMPTTPFNGNPYGPPPLHQGSGVQGVGNTGSWNPGQDHRSNWSSNNPRGPQPAGQGYGQQLANWGNSANQASRNQWGNGYALPTPPMQPASQVWGVVQGTASIAPSPPSGVPPTGTGWASMNTPAPPIPHPACTGWGTPNMPARPAPFRPMMTGWGANSAAGVHDGQSGAASMEHNRAGPATNSMGSTGAWGSNSTMPKVASQVTGDNHAHVPRRQQTGAPNVIETRSAVSPRNASPRSQSNHGTAVNRNIFFDSGCPSPTPSNEREVHPAAQPNESDTVNRRWEANEGMVSGLAPLSSAQAVSDSPSELQSGALKLGSSSHVETDPHDNMSPIRDTEAKPTASALAAMPPDKSEAVVSLSAHREEESAPAFGMKQDPDGQIHIPTPSTMTEPGLPKVEHLETSELVGPQDTTRENSSWSLPSPTPASKPSGWNAGAVSPSSINQNKPFSQQWGGSSAGPSQASQSGWITGDRDAPSTGWGLAPQDAKTSAGSVTGDVNRGIAQGSEIITWGDPSVRNANPSQGWGTWVERMNSKAGNEDEKNSGWGTGPTEGASNSHQNSGWGSGQEDTNGQQNQSVDRYRGGHARDSGYEPRRGDFPRHGEDSRHDSRYGSRHGGDSRYDPSHTVGRGQRNDRMSRDRRGMPSRAPPSGDGRGGICKFHEGGHCKKGAACNYVHS